MAAPAVAKLSWFGDCWCTSKALAVITSTSIGNIGCQPTFPTLDPCAALAALVVAELSQFGNCCTSTVGPAVVTTVDSDSTHHSVVGAVTMVACFRLALASNQGLILS
ncbi:hypothetical protein K439DRAFT_1625014 [Ramaria rubella]|nr:hypothetical protein K439DRAFT_1625014 [Ramaria rubella]